MTIENGRELPLPCVDASFPLPHELDVTGGWGYTKEHPCVLLDFGGEGAGVPCEYAFVDRRLSQELRIMVDRDRFDDFRWELVRQRLLTNTVTGERFDMLEVHVSALRSEDVAVLDEVRRRHGDEGPRFEEARSRLAFVAVREFWFDLRMLDFPLV